MHIRRYRPPEYPPTRHLSTLTTFTPHYSYHEGMTVIPADSQPLLTERDRRVLELENKGYTLVQTFILPDSHKPSGNIGNVSILRADPERLAIDGILTAWATQRIAVAVEEYGADNVAICKDMRLPSPHDSAYEPYEYMALYVRNGASTEH